MLLFVFAILFIFLFVIFMSSGFEETAMVFLIATAIISFILFVGSVLNAAKIDEYKKIVDCFENTNTNLLNEYIKEKNKLKNIYEAENIKHFKIFACDPEIYTEEDVIAAKRKLTEIKNDTYTWFFRGSTIEDKYLLEENLAIKN